MKGIDIKYIGVPNICFSLTDEDDKREKKFHKQRIKRGFDDSELWNLDGTICQFILPRIRVYKENCVGYPCSLTEDKWNEILSKMITAFELAIKDNNGGILSEEEEKQVKKGMKLFHKYFFNLWD